MILASKWGNRELRTQFGDSSPARSASAWLSASGVAVTPDQAFGLPAVSNVIRSPAEVIASLPFVVYTEGETKERAPESWQYELLHDRPSSECDTFEFFYDLALSLEATQNAFLQKAKFRSRVYELYVLDPQRVTVKRDRETGEKRFDVYLSSSNVRRDIGTDEILHIRGFSPAPGAVAGMSLLHQHRDPLGAAIAMQKFEGDYFRNSGLSPLFFELGERGNAQQAKEMVDFYQAQHAQPGNRFKVSAVWGGTGVKPVPLGLDDALFAEAKRLSIEDACRIWRWPKKLLEMGDETAEANEDAWTARFLKFYLLPRLKRIERAFAADPDLFWASGLFGEFLTAALERADFVTRVRERQ